MERSETLEHLFQESSREIGVTTDQNQTHLFLLYLHQLKLWNQSFNLTAITKDEEIIVKHFIDSLAALPAVSIGPASRILDIGAGAGFPGIPLKIVRPDLYITLIEPVHKKSSFLHFIVGHLRLKGVDVFQGTIESFTITHPSATTFDYITTRALNPSLIFHNAQNLLSEYGKVVIYSARPLDRTSLPRNWSVDYEHIFELPHNYGPRTISVLSHRSNISSLTVPRGT